jgi:hypothetical protein
VAEDVVDQAHLADSPSSFFVDQNARIDVKIKLFTGQLGTQDKQNTSQNKHLPLENPAG